MINFCDKKEDHFDVIVFALRENKTLPKDFSSNTIDLPTFCVFLNRVVFFKIYVKKKL